MMGAPPQPADQRGTCDRVDAALGAAAKHYSQPLVDIVHWCLKQNPLERPQSVFALQRALREPVHVASATAPPPRAPALARWLDSLGGRRRRAIRQESTLLWPTQKASS